MYVGSPRISKNFTCFAVVRMVYKFQLYVLIKIILKKKKNFQSYASKMPGVWDFLLITIRCYVGSCHGWVTMICLVVNVCTHFCCVALKQSYLNLVELVKIESVRQHDVKDLSS